ncbi:hypothetical protein ACFQZI_16365 [Mucilaginibacter lutimaris]|uniref:Uncharacterized protein n=1 Tax=Mucilaginibacter lutimaris TaxID=931629 RepID=A0ABW2ZJU0_9SPHI
MKNINLLIIAFLFISSTAAFSQSKTEEDTIDYNQLYLTSKKSNIKFADLKTSTVTKLLGNPTKIKKEKWETNNADVVETYVYTNGDIVFEDNVLSFIDVNRSGWAFTFKIKNKFTRAFTVGSKVDELKQLFPNSWANHKSNIVRVQIGTSDTAIVFSISGSIITQVSLFTDES